MKWLWVLVFLFSNASFGQSSAYNILRTQFDQSRQPNLEDLQVNQLWYCSGSLEAANGMFRQVRLWEPAFKFSKKVIAKDKFEIENIGYRKTGTYKNHRHKQQRLCQKIL